MVLADLGAIGRLLRALGIWRGERPAVERDGVVSWPFERGGRELQWAEYATVDEYVDLVSRGQYSFLLTDGSFFQFTVASRNEDVRQARYVYFPSPIDASTLSDTDLFSVDELVDMALRDEDAREFVLLRSPIRYEFDRASANPNHPETHLHVNTAGARIAARAFFGPVHFAVAVLEHFYGVDYGVLEKTAGAAACSISTTAVDQSRDRVAFDFLRKPT